MRQRAFNQNSRIGWGRCSAKDCSDFRLLRERCRNKHPTHTTIPYQHKKQFKTRIMRHREHRLYEGNSANLQPEHHTTNHGRQRNKRQANSASGGSEFGSRLEFYVYPLARSCTHAESGISEKLDGCARRCHDGRRGDASKRVPRWPFQRRDFP